MCGGKQHLRPVGRLAAVLTCELDCGGSRHSDALSAGGVAHLLDPVLQLDHNQYAAGCLVCPGVDALAYLGLHLINDFG